MVAGTCFGQAGQKVDGRMVREAFVSRSDARVASIRAVDRALPDSGVSCRDVT